MRRLAGRANGMEFPAGAITLLGFVDTAWPYTFVGGSATHRRPFAGGEMRMK